MTLSLISEMGYYSVGEENSSMSIIAGIKYSGVIFLEELMELKPYYTEKDNACILIIVDTLERIAHTLSGIVQNLTPTVSITSVIDTIETVTIIIRTQG